MTVHSPSANCETDDSEGGLDDLRRFLSSRTEEPQITEPAVANIDMHEVGNAVNGYYSNKYPFLHSGLCYAKNSEGIMPLQRMFMIFIYWWNDC